MEDYKLSIRVTNFQLMIINFQFQIPSVTLLAELLGKAFLIKAMKMR